MNRLRLRWHLIGLCFFLSILLPSTGLAVQRVTTAAFAQTAPTDQTPTVRILRRTNIRSGPGTDTSVITVAQPEQRFPITGQSADGRWWQIDYNGQEGWVFAALVEASGQLEAPAADRQHTATATPTPGATAAEGAVVAVQQRINVRGGPGVDFPIIGSGQPGEQFAVTGKNESGAWWRIDYRGQVGWLFASRVQAQNADDVAVVAAPAPVHTPAAVSAPASAAGFDPQRIRFRLQPILAGLGQPTQVTNAGDGSGRLFVVERAGRVRVFPGPQSEGQTFLDIEDRVGDKGPEQGLFSIAFPANFAATGYFFINYTNNDGDTVIARYRVSDNPDQADRDSESVVLFIKQPAANHNGGLLLFGPDGYLWAGMGDGGGANDTFHNGQNPGTLLGKMLRLDVTSDPSAPYRIPPDNPWVTANWNGQDVLDEVWAMGLRNPWRFSFDRRIGDLWIADVGESQSEEIDFVPAAQVRQGALNFGWPAMEGPHCLAGDCAAAGYVLPTAEYGHAGNGCSITGGYVYRGQAFPLLNGVYFYADYCSGNLWALWRTAAGMQSALVLPKAAAISSFGEDEAGEIYVTDIGGGIVYQLVGESVSP